MSSHRIQDARRPAAQPVTRSAIAAASSTPQQKSEGKVQGVERERAVLPLTDAEPHLSYQGVRFAEWAGRLWSTLSAPNDPDDFESMKLHGRLCAFFMAGGTADRHSKRVEVTQDALLLQLLADPLQRDRCADLDRRQLVDDIDRLLEKLDRVNSLTPQALGAAELDPRVVEGARLMFIDELTRLRAETLTRLHADALTR